MIALRELEGPLVMPAGGPHTEAYAIAERENEVREACAYARAVNLADRVDVANEMLETELTEDDYARLVEATDIKESVVAELMRAAGWGH